MSDELKSAWEIALEKLEGDAGGAVRELSEEQRTAIAETRRKFQARIAEKEIETQGRISQATQAGEVHQIEALRNELALERRRLEEQMESKVEQIRQGEAD